MQNQAFYRTGIIGIFFGGGNFASSKREFPVIQINVASLSAYCVRACKIKHFTERELSGFFSLAGGILRLQNGNSRWPCLSRAVSELSQLIVQILDTLRF